MARVNQASSEIARDEETDSFNRWDEVYAPAGEGWLTDFFSKWPLPEQDQRLIRETVLQYTRRIDGTASHGRTRVHGDSRRPGCGECDR